MRKLNVFGLMFACACALTISPLAAATGPGHDHSGSHAQNDRDKPINRTCPISGERINADSPTTTYRGHVIAFCCGGCEKPFAEWSVERKNRYVAAALQSGNSGQTAERRNRQNDDRKDADSKDADKKDAAWKGDPYTLNVCPVSGMELGSMGDPPIKTFDGREVRFCCAGCIGEFQKNKEEKFAEIDKKLIEQQMPYYPMDTCVVSGEKLTAMGEPVNRIYKNRLVRFCCKMCTREFEKDPAKFITKLDRAVIAKQKKEYPLQSCPVSGMSLGSMGEPVEMVVANRLVRFCCADCKPKFMKEPATYLAKIDEAWGRKHRGKSDDNSTGDGRGHGHGHGNGHDHPH